MGRSCLLFIVLLSAVQLASAQIAQSFTLFAETVGDPHDGNGIASDDCADVEFLQSSTAGFDIEISMFFCSINSGDGEPEAKYTYSSYIDHSGVIDIKNYIGYTIPLGFSVSVMTDQNGSSNSIGEQHLTANYGSNLYSFSKSEASNVDLSLDTISVSTAQNLLLTSDGYSFDYEYSIKSQNDDNEFFLTGVESAALNIVLPSQFYSDNQLTVPTIVNIPDAISSVSFPVLTACAENIFLGEDIDLDSYQYASSARLSAASTVKADSMVILSGGDCVLLDPGFSVELGGMMETVDYTGCTN